MVSKAIIIIAIIVVAVVAIIAVTSFSPAPNFDMIIEEKDCGKALALTEPQMSQANADQQIKLGLLLAACTVDSMLK